MLEQKLFDPIKSSGRALYDDGQVIKSNVINHVIKVGLDRMPAAGELRCVDAAFESVLGDIDSAFILKEEQRTRRRRQSAASR